jgi:hypothetical protein
MLSEVSHGSECAEHMVSYGHKCQVYIFLFSILLDVSLFMYPISIIFECGSKCCIVEFGSF